MAARGRGEEMVRVASAPNAAIAELWKGILANEGIPALVRMAGPLTAYVTFASAHDLLTLASDAPEARAILAAFNENEGDLIGDEWAEEGDDTPAERQPDNRE